MVAVEPFIHLYIQNQGDWKLRAGFLGKLQKTILHVTLSVVAPWLLHSRLYRQHRISGIQTFLLVWFNTFNSWQEKQATRQTPGSN